MKPERIALPSAKPAREGRTASSYGTWFRVRSGLQASGSHRKKFQTEIWWKYLLRTKEIIIVTMKYQWSYHIEDGEARARGALRAFVRHLYLRSRVSIKKLSGHEVHFTA